MNNAIMRMEGRALAAYAILLMKTCRTDVKGWEYIADTLDDGPPCIFAGWHGQTHMYFPFVKDRLELSRLAMVVVADHREVVLSTFGRTIGGQIYPISMEDTTLTAARRMIELTKALKAGKFSYITPDGPDGPPRVAKEGVAFLATRVEARLIPVGAYCRTCYRLKRWDRYALPLPFSRIRLVVGEPIQATRDMDRTQLLVELSRRMTEVLEEAETG